MKTLQLGSRGVDVVALQKRLFVLGYLPLKERQRFDSETENAVKAFQKYVGLKADGKVGKYTLAKLQVKPPGGVVKTTPRTIEEYQAKYRAASIQPAKMAVVTARAKLLLKYKASHYEPVANRFGIPWWMVAVIHNQEAGSDVGKFKAVLHNGQKIVGTGKKTTIVPKGLGPFATWKGAAIDALERDGVRSVNTVGEALEFLEKFNGLGYRSHGVATPYIWAMTDQYTKGHYAGDHNWRPNEVSKNFGAAAILLALGV